jgi:diacylglycerol O-acyltransferase
MSDRLSPLDVSFLYLEEETTPMHVGSVAVFQAPGTGFDRDSLSALIADRIALVPRYRQKVRWVPGRIANPVWVDDDQFDIDHHLRLRRLPEPGADSDLRELVGEVMAERLDRSRPLWEMYIVEGLSDHRFAVVTKTHHAMVDGATALDIGQVILDDSPLAREVIVAPWVPRPEPTGAELVLEAVAEAIRTPAIAVDALRSEAVDLQVIADRLARSALGIFSAVRTLAAPTFASALNADIGVARRFGTVAADLDDFKAIRKAHGGTINDVVLAVVAGALRSWLMSRGDKIATNTVVYALVPMSIRSEGTSSGNQVTAYICPLPVGESQPVVRLGRVSYEMNKVKSAGQGVAAETLVGVAGFAPPTLHALGARSASELSRKMFNTVISNVPGPQFPLYADGARMIAAYPVVPLAKGQAVSIGLTSYDGGVYFGLNADYDTMADIDLLAECIQASLEELRDTVYEPGSVAMTPKQVRSAPSRSLAAGTKPAPRKAVPARQTPPAQDSHTAD